jgi:hypothetical protein
VAAVMTATALSAAVLAVAGPAQAASAEESKVVALTNQVRASVGVPALAWDEEMARTARAWAAKMAADGIISHNPTYTRGITGSWTKASENVGQGPDIDTIHRALVASHSHYVNMTDTEVTSVGVGVVVSGNTVFIVENFVGRAGAPAPKVTTTKAPAPPATVSRPATTVAPKAPAAPKPAPTTTAPPPTVPAPVGKALVDASPWGDLVIDLRTLELATG